MSLNASHKTIVSERRRLVAFYRLRGASIREIIHLLATADKDHPNINPKTGQPWNVATIKSDLDALNKEWREESMAAIDEHRARQMAEIVAIKRLAWGNKDGDLALKAVGLEMKLLGTDQMKVIVQGDALNQLELLLQLAQQKSIAPKDMFAAMIQQFSGTEYEQ